ncbi:unnamed protein product [Alopecurus aequalis]
MAAAARSGGALLALSLLVAWLLLGVVEARASYRGGPRSYSASPRRSSANPDRIIRMTNKAPKAGKKLLIKKKYGNTGTDLLGRAAADNAGFVVYNVTVGSGATATNFSGVVDIAGELIWGQCPSPPAPAFSRIPCASQTCLSVLNVTAADCASANATVCDYIIDYGLGMNTTGYFSEETFTVDVGAVARPVVFGCTTASTVPLDGESGVIGFSRGAYSLMSQLNISRFSYFLAPDDADSSDSESVVLLADDAVPQTRRSSSTPLLRSAAYPDFYYVKLTSIQVDGVALDGIPVGAFDLSAGGESGGAVMTTLSPVTYLHSAAYAAVRRALVSKIKSAPVNGSALDGGVFDLCYNTLSVANLTFPKITFVLGTATMDLTTVHYFYKDNTTGLQCLTMLPMPAGQPFGSILGSLLQTGTHMIYDVDGGQLTFETAAATLAGKQVSLGVIASLLLAWVLLIF